MVFGLAHQLKASLYRVAKKVRAAIGPGVDAESRQLVDQIFDESPSFTVLVSYPELKFLRANRAYLELVGHSNLVGRSIVEVLPEFEANGLAAMVTQVATTQKRFVGTEVAIVLADPSGKTKTEYFDFVYLPLLNSRGETYAILGQGSAVTDRVRARREVEENEFRLELATRVAKIAVWDLDLGTNECTVNDLVYELYDLPEGQPIRSEDVFAKIHPDDSLAVQSQLKSAVENRTEYIGEFRVPRGDGTIRWVYSHGKATYATDGTPLRMYGINLDMTERKEVEQALRSAKEEAVRASQLKSDFLANMSHEIRTPLGAMLGFAHLLDDANLTHETRANYVNILKRNGENLSVIINDILDLSKVEAGHLVMEFTAANPRQIIDEVVSLMTVKSEEKEIELIFDCEASTPDKFVTDPIRLRQILFNIIGNAVKFTARGSVRLRSYGIRTPDDRKVLGLEVSDTGIGISPARKHDIFEAFIQADNSMTRKYGGTGLGLALSRKLAHAMGGDVRLLTSQEGQGSCFLITLDEQIESMDADAPERLISGSRSETGGGGTSSAKALSGLRILIVDDSADNRQLIRHFLIKHGAQIAEAENGRQGLELALSHDFDVVLMDLQMPVMDGYTATSRLRSYGYAKPIIALTAHAMSDVAAKCKQAGCTAHLPKPIDFPQIVTRLVDLTKPT